MAIVDFAGYGYKGGAIDFTDYDVVTVTSLPQASEDTMGHIYQVGPDANNNYDRYYTQKSGDTYSWVPMGSTQMDLSDYAKQSDVDELSRDIVRKADIDGSYDSMAVGLAKNLEGRTNVTDSFFKRTTGGDAEVANGTAQLNEVKGKSQVWNQLVQNGNFADGLNHWSPTNVSASVSNGVVTITPTTQTYTANNLNCSVPCINGHKYYFAFEYKGDGNGICYAIDNGGISLGPNAEFTTIKVIRTSSGYQYCRFYPDGAGGYSISHSMQIRNIRIIDLTLLGIDNLETVEEVEAWLAENIGEQAYYPYNPGEVLNNKMTGVESIGFNLLDPATGKADIIGAYSDVYGNYYGITGTHGTLTFTDKFGNTETITPDEDGKFLLEKAGTLTVATPGDDCAVFLWWDGTQTEYKPYEKNVGALDVTHIYGKLNGVGEYVRVWPTGMPGIGDIKDSLKVVDGQVVAERKIGEVDLGTLDWGYSTNRLFFTGGQIGNIAHTDGWNSPIPMICARYRNTYPNNVYNENLTTNDKTISGHPSQNVVWLRDSAYSDGATFKAAMSGVLLYYSLATPQVFTDLIYRDSESFADNTPVTLPVNYKVDNWGIERIAPQNTEEAVVTTKPELTMRYSIDAVEELNTHRDEIEDLYEKSEDLDERKPEKYGEYPDMAVGSAKTLAGNDTKVEDFVFKAIDCADGLAKLNSARGKSLVWNQLLQNGNFADGTNGWASGGGVGAEISVSDNTLTIASIDESGKQMTVRQPNVNIVAGRKVYIAFSINPSENFNGRVSYVTYIPTPYTFTAEANKWTRVSCISQVGSNGMPSFLIYGTNEIMSWQLRNVILIDLTLMFGAGNEPATVAEFEAMFPLPYYDYNPGEIISNKTEEVKVAGFNQWDEEWESGLYSSAGIKQIDNTAIRSVNFVPVFPNTVYYYNKSSARILAYDSKKQFLSMISNSIVAGTFTTPEDCHYLLFAQRFEAVYQNDICINLSDPNRNGEYEPYKTNTIELNLPTLTGKLNGEGESVVVFPDGLKSAGSVYDEIVGNKAIKRVGVVDLGTLDWGRFAYNTDEFYYFRTIVSGGLPAHGAYVAPNIVCDKYANSATANTPSLANKNITSYGPTAGVLLVRDDSYSDAATFKVAMDGVLLYYELATPEEYILDAPLPDTFQAYKGGTIKQLPENTSEPVTAPCVLTATYAIDAVGQLVGLPRNYVSKESLQAMLNAMQSAGIIASYTMTYNENTGKYDFTFVAPTNE